MTGDLWLANKGARERLALWLDAPSVERFRRAWSRPSRYWLEYLHSRDRDLPRSRSCAVIQELEELDPWTPSGDGG